MHHDSSEKNSSRRGKALGDGVCERGEAHFSGDYALRDALADTEVREVSLAEFLAELKKCGRQFA
jgi:hypothetical protein